MPTHSPANRPAMPPVPPSGQAMDRALPPRPRWRRWAWPVATGLALAAGAWGLAQRSPAAPTVASPQLATVSVGVLRDELALRGRAEPLQSVQLDAPEAGQVVAVLARDGDAVTAGAPLYRLHSAEQTQLLLQRSAEVAQQLANVSVQRSAQLNALAQGRRALAQLASAEQQARSEQERLALLADAGFVAPAALEQADRQHRLASQLLAQAREDLQEETQTQARSLAEMQRAVQGLQEGLRLLQGARDRLLQRAPMAGRLSGLALQVGASVRAGDRLGRIDDPQGGVQLVAEVDEYHLPRLRPGQPAQAADGSAWTLAQVLPQVQGGKGRLVLRAQATPGANPPELQPGQALDLRLQLSPPTPALLLPEGPGVQTTLFMRRDHRRPHLHRTTVQLGRRAGGQVEVLAGLQAGDDVLISSPPTLQSDTLALP